MPESIFFGFSARIFFDPRTKIRFIQIVKPSDTMKRTAKSHWQGSGKEGKGHLTTETKALNELPYSFKTRFGDDTSATNPEELIAAAHSGCFNMALAVELSKAGASIDSLDTTASVNIEKGDGGFTIDKIHLDVRASVSGIDEEGFMQAANGAKTNCPVSKVLAGAEISMDAKLVGASQNA